MLFEADVDTDGSNVTEQGEELCMRIIFSVL